VVKTVKHIKAEMEQAFLLGYKLAFETKKKKKP